MCENLIVFTFILLDLDNSSLFFMTYDDDVVFNSLKWHARLGHIGKDRMARLICCWVT